MKINETVKYLYHFTAKTDNKTGAGAVTITINTITSNTSATSTASTTTSTTTVTTTATTTSSTTNVFPVQLPSSSNSNSCGK